MGESTAVFYTAKNVNIGPSTAHSFLSLLQNQTALPG